MGTIETTTSWRVLAAKWWQENVHIECLAWMESNTYVMAMIPVGYDTEAVILVASKPHCSGSKQMLNRKTSSEQFEIKIKQTLCIRSGGAWQEKIFWGRFC